VQKDHRHFRKLLASLETEDLTQEWQIELLRPNELNASNVALSVFRICNGQGRPVRLHWLVRDLTERAQTEKLLSETEERFRLLVEGVNDYAIFMLNPDGTVVSWNAGAQRIKGYRAEEIIGKHFSCFYRQEDVACGEPQRLLKKATAGGWVAEEGWRVRQDGSLFWASVLVTALLDNSGQLRGFSKVTHDITERKRADEELRRSEAYLAEGQRLSHTGSWAWNASSGEIFSSQELLRIFGLEAATAPPTHETFLQVIHPEDRERIRQAFDGATHSRADYVAEYRIVRADGSLRHVHNLAHPVFNESGALVEYVGTAMDITERYHAAAALSKALEEIHVLKERLYHENVALRDELDRTSMFEEIVGSSHAVRAVLSRVAKVAPTESTVLITGETGTGKELIARAIHKRSKRAERPFITFNCAGIPLSLIASELFGHERGAFTGAQQRRLGRFELAEGGTIFLDEVGELPAETQIALLRVIQERDFERVGGSQSITADVRIIAATNRDLEAAIVAGRFRLDLFYRLNVFPIEVPPLRERKQDIPLLLDYLVKRHAKKAGKNIQKIDTKTVELFTSYPWPGNIRELQSVIERSVILCDSEVFSVDDRWLSRLPVPTRGRSSTLSDMLLEQEREIIESALVESKGRIAGPAGAAAKLGIPSSTLESKIRILEIKKNRFKSD
jgi:PAS domain S-box-containing protein